jgi:D-glycero-D-manno-heptose 1,7-bisphosphate phosphatase
MTVAMPKNSERRFVILDRDGTIIEEREYLADPEQVTLISGVAAALRELQRMGFGLVVITNQSGIGRGFFDQAQLQQVHQRLEEMLQAERIHLNGLYVCPHTPEDDCACRKPKLGLLRKAAEDLGFDMANSIVIGDKASDIEMGSMAGALTFLVRTGYGAQVENEVAADYVVDDLAAAIASVQQLMDVSSTVSHDR